MKVYLVGGAVRDKLLGYPVKERDWVVVGATPKQMLEQGYQQVGRDFPVFLHPKTKEEYALARTERKMGAGYYGFECDFNPHVTLEEDLVRRDLSINAMAIDTDGQLIDPYNGQQDLQAKVLRHVSPAFIEDPVRVLRIARFCARYHHLGFQVANETRSLMYQMVINGDLEHLVPERVWQEWYRSLEERDPNQFILLLRSCGALRVVIPELDYLFGVPNSLQYHPEVDTGIHSLLVLNAVVLMSDDPMIRFAALVHDLGKACTSMEAWPAHYGHDDSGVAVIDQLCERLRIPTDYRKFAIMVSRFHLKIHRLYEMQASMIVTVLEQVDAFRRPQLFYNLLVVCEADAREAMQITEYTQARHWRDVLEQCTTINAKILIAEGFEGAAIKEGLHQRRVNCIKQLMNSWGINEK